jgi:hypothetical protein
MSSQPAKFQDTRFALPFLPQIADAFGGPDF